MDGLARAAGAGTTVTVNGTTYLMGAMTLKDYGLVEQHLLTSRKSALDAIMPDLAKLSEEDRKFLLKEAMLDMKKNKESV